MRNEQTWAIHVDREKCIGCRMCIYECPFGAISIREEDGTTTNCLVCDGEPRCVQVVDHLGLVDRLGGLDDAVKYAAAQANISDYKIRVIPKAKNIFEMLMEDLMDGEEEEEEVSARLGTRLFSPGSPLPGELLPMLNRLDPVRTQAILRTLQRLELLHHERVLTVMPTEIIIR